MELIQVKTCDVYPDGNNPRTDFGDLEALADTFDLNRTRPGEPVEPPQLVRDGGIYLIADGERRYRAMKMRGKESFWAIVYDDWDEADSVMAMLVTDNKERLGDLGTSRGVQRALRLGVAPARIEKATGLKGVDKAARAARKAGDAAEDMTFERLLALDEFADSDKDVAKILNAPENLWREYAAQIRRRRESEERKAAFERVAADHGLEVVEGIDRTAWTTRPEGCDRDLRWNTVFSLPDRLSEFLDGCDPEWGVPVVLVDMRPGADVYFPRPEKAADSAPQVDPELAKRAAALSAAVDNEEERQRAWAAELFKSGETEKRTSLGPDLHTAFLDGVMTVDFDRWPELEGCHLSPIDYAMAWDDLAPDAMNDYYVDIIVGIRENLNIQTPIFALDWLDVLDAAGYPANDDTRLIRSEIEAWRDRGIEEGE